MMIPFQAVSEKFGWTGRWRSTPQTPQPFLLLVAAAFSLFPTLTCFLSSLNLSSLCHYIRIVNPSQKSQNPQTFQQRWCANFQVKEPSRALYKRLALATPLLTRSLLSERNKNHFLLHFLVFFVFTNIFDLFLLLLSSHDGELQILSHVKIANYKCCQNY